MCHLRSNISDCDIPHKVAFFPTNNLAKLLDLKIIGHSYNNNNIG